MPLQDGTQLQQIGQALGGFGAGIQGNAPQYQAAQQTIAASKQEMEEARTKAMYADALGALNFAEAGDWDGAVQLGMNRLQALQQLNANPEDTQRIMKVLLAAKNGSEEAKDLAKAELESIVETGYVSGALERPERQIIKGADGRQRYVDTGELVYDIAYSEIIDDASDAIMGEQRRVRDEVGNFCMETNVFDKSSGGTRRSITPFGTDEDIEPVGDLVDVNDLGQTWQEAAGSKVATSTRTAAQKAGLEIGINALNSLAPIESNISQLNEVVRLIDSGAGTGPIRSMLPGFTDATNELRRLNAAMGLNIVQRTTFGSLSKGELDLALNVAMPENLREPALRDWAIEQARVQTILLGEIQEQAHFMGGGQKTITDWLEFVSGRKRLEDAKTRDESMTLKELTQADIDGSAKLQEIGAQVGQSYNILPNGDINLY